MYGGGGLCACRSACARVLCALNGVSCVCRNRVPDTEGCGKQAAAGAVMFAIIAGGWALWTVRRHKLSASSDDMVETTDMWQFSLLALYVLRRAVQSALRTLHALLTPRP